MKLNDITIIDDLIPKSFADEIEKTLTADDFSWYFINDLALTEQIRKQRGVTELRPGLHHQYKTQPNGEVVCPTYHLIKSIPYFALKSLGIDEELNVFRARSFLHLPNTLSGSYEHDGIHRDMIEKHIVCLYYVNETDGDTLFYSRKRNGQDYGEITQRITPQKGRVVIFDGSIFHCSSPPTKNVRININFDIDTNKNDYFTL